MKIVERCWSELEYLSFTATYWEAVIFIALVLLADNVKSFQVFHGVLSCPCSHSFSWLDRKLTGLHIFFFSDVFFMLDKVHYNVFKSSKCHICPLFWIFLPHWFTQYSSFIFRHVCKHFSCFVWEMSFL